MTDKKKKKSTKGPPSKDREGPLSIDLSPEEALTKFMQADPDKVEERLRQKGVKKPKK